MNNIVNYTASFSLYKLLDEDVYKNMEYYYKFNGLTKDEVPQTEYQSHTQIKEFITKYEKLSSLSKETLEPVIKSLIEKHKTNFKGVGQPLRIALVGSRFGPGLYDVILSLDKTKVIKRLDNIK